MATRRKLSLVTTTTQGTGRAGTVRLAAVARDLRLPRTTQQALIEENLVTPTAPIVRGRPTRIPEEEEAELRRAAAVAAAVGASIVIVLRILRVLGAA